MTLGGLSLAVGILVDDATVEIENIHRNLAQKKPHRPRDPRRRAADRRRRRSSRRCASASSSCRSSFITGAAKSLFVPLAHGRRLRHADVVLPVAHAGADHGALPARGTRPSTTPGARSAARASPAASSCGFERGFERAAHGSTAAGSPGRSRTARVVDRRLPGASSSASLLALPARRARLLPHRRRRASSSCTCAARRARASRRPSGASPASRTTIRTVIPPDEIETMLDNIGMPYSGINLSLSEGALISSADGEILISLKEEHAPTAEYVRKLRAKLSHRLSRARRSSSWRPTSRPRCSTSASPRPSTCRSSAPLGNEDADLRGRPAARGAHQGRCPARSTCTSPRSRAQPELRIDVDRTMAGQRGSPSATSPATCWSRCRRAPGGAELLARPSAACSTSSPCRRRSTRSTPSTRSNRRRSRRGAATAAAALATSRRSSRTDGAGQHHPLQRRAHLRRAGQRRRRPTSASVADAACRRSSPSCKPHAAARHARSRIKGQVESMESSFRGLGYGLVFAVVLVYLLMVVNFQSWLDPLIILMALPGALAGIVWMLFLSQHDAQRAGADGRDHVRRRRHREQHPRGHLRQRSAQASGATRRRAALAAGMTRLRPVIMTALAMIIGMLPMSLGLGEGGEQNAPLGRAVIGGLSLATADHAVLRARDVQRAARQAAGLARPSRGGRMTPPRDRGLDPNPSPRASRRRTSTSSASICRRPLRCRSRGRCVLGRLRARRARRRRSRTATCRGARRERRWSQASRRRRRARCASRSMTPKAGSSDRAIALPGSVQPLEETVIYARASGYVRKWYVDIGDKVKEGQLLAEIDTPELDQELDQARAQLAGAGRRIASAVEGQPRAVAGEPRSATSSSRPPASSRRPSSTSARRRPQVDEASVTVAQASDRGAAGEHPAPRAAQVVRARDRAVRRARSRSATVEIGHAGDAPATVSRCTRSPRMDPARVFIQVPQDVAPSVRAGRRRDGDGARVSRPHVRRAPSRARRASSIRRRAR